MESSTPGVVDQVREHGGAVFALKFRHAAAVLASSQVTQPLAVAVVAPSGLCVDAAGPEKAVQDRTEELYDFSHGHFLVEMKLDTTSPHEK